MSESKTNQCDYTLPPLPAHPDAYNGDFWSTRTTRALHSWGQECAEAARAPLLARLARPAHAHLVGDHINGLVDGCILCDSIKERDAMRARIAELEADAKRYRWLRECDDGADRELHTPCRSELLSGAALDDAVDRLIKEYGDA